MKHLSLVISLTATVMAFTSCKKDDKDQPLCRMTGATLSSSGTTTTYAFTYDDNDRLATVQQSSGTTTDLSVFSYTGNVVLITRATNGTITMIDSLVLNSNNMIQYAKNRVVGTSTYSESVVTYNGEQLVKIASSSNGGPVTEQTATFTGNNLTALQSGGSITTYAYNDDRTSQPGDYLNFVQFAQYGTIYIKNLNTVKSSTSAGSAMDFTYNYDSDGKIAGLQITEGATLSTLAYTYTCS